MNSKGGTGCFEIKLRTDTAKFTNMRSARFIQSRVDNQVSMKCKTKMVRKRAELKTYSKLNETRHSELDARRLVLYDSSIKV